MSTMDQSRQSPPPNSVSTEGGPHTAAPTAWLIRAGRNSERYDYNIEHGLVGLGWSQIPDLRSFSSRDDLEAALRLGSPDASGGTISNHAGQLWRLRTELRVDDLVVMPRKGAPHIALGTVTREYWYDDDDPEPDWRHFVSVDWKRTDVTRTAVKQDLLHSLGAQMTICTITRHDGAWRLQQLLETGRDPGARVGDASGSDKEGLNLSSQEEEHENQVSDLLTLVEQFRIESSYPTEAHEHQERLRAEWADKLAPENISSFSRSDLTAVTNYTNKRVWLSRYVEPAPGIMKWINDLNSEEYSKLLRNIEYLCWGEDELWTRIDQLTDNDSERRTPGFAWANVSRVLAICHPEEIVPIDVNWGRWGRRRALKELGLRDPHGSTNGQVIVNANDQIRRHLEPYFGNDTLGMGAFLEWLFSRPDDPEIEQPPAADMDARLAELADELLLDAHFVDDIVELLRDKGQVILYGPPGTGKTYLARKLGKALAPDDSCRSLVQFHPSTSYEDFFEGYRPAGTGAEGGIRYELTLGPLARMAERADAASDRQHVMIIDEINRGNLPRVLGELLFLLEYRNESVHPLYRPDEQFSLPKNLWFIGTMNTADRSIALVDTALRRRFHFVPFFPDREPIAGLLGRWLERQDEPAWVGHLVDAVNDGLKTELEGSHLLLGPSHFMKEYGDSPDEQRERLLRIWEYNIEPFIEDQFFGAPDRIAHFRFDAVMTRYGPTQTEAAAGDGPDGANGADEALEGDAAADAEN